MGHIILVRKAYIPNFIPLITFLYVKKFVVGVKTWILVLSLRYKLNNSLIVVIEHRENTEREASEKVEDSIKDNSCSIMVVLGLICVEF